LKEYLKNKIGEKLGVTRFGMPQEVYFEAVLKGIEAEVAIFEDEKGRSFALGIDRIILVGPPERKEDGKSKPGFSRVVEPKKT
jgi:hypothetical protein